MAPFLLRPVRFLAQVFSEESTPRQLALGFAMGLLIGLVPKGNLTALVLMSVLCMTRVNLGAGALAAFVFSWCGLLTDPLTHRLGLWLLHLDWLTPIWTYLYNVPVIPWTAFNNTVVMGSLVLGLAMFFPAYRLSWPLFERYMPSFQQRVRKYRLVQVLWGAEWAGRLSEA